MNQVSVEDQELPVHQLPVAVCCTAVSMDATPESSVAVPLDRDDRQRQGGALRRNVERDGRDLRVGAQAADEDVADDVGSC